MVKTVNGLKKCLFMEKKLYTPIKKRDAVLAIISHDYTWKLWKYIKALRISEYFFNNCSVRIGQRTIFSLVCDMFYVIWRFIRNKRGQNLGIEIWENCFGTGLLIYHSAGGILLNGSARVGKNCKLHGNNCIGNKDGGTPVIGNNVDIGFGVVIIGNIVIGDNTIIGAGAVVTNSFPEGHVVLAGIPARIINVL